MLSGAKHLLFLADDKQKSRSFSRVCGIKMAWARPSSQSARRDILAMLLLAACVVALFWRVCFTHAMFFYRDVFNYTYPDARLIHEVCRKAELPYWNPYLNYGQELLANPNFLFFYPFTLAIVLLPVDCAYTMHYVLHFILAAIGLYWLGRRWCQSRVAALSAAVFFVLSGPILSLGSFYNHVACAAWTPWALLLTAIAVESRSWRPWLLLSCVYALQFLAGEPFTLLGTVGLSAAYGLWRLRRSDLRAVPMGSREKGSAFPATGLEQSEKRKEGGSAAVGLLISDCRFSIARNSQSAIGNRPSAIGERQSRHSFARFFDSASGSGFPGLARLLLRFAVVGGLALGLSAILLLPSSQLLRNSVRGAHGLSFSEVSFWSFHPLSLLEMVLPNFYGSVENPTAWTEAVGTPNTPYFPSVFLGFVPLFLALVGWAWGRDRRRNFVAGAGTLSLLLSMGRFTPLFTLAYRLAPPLRLVRFPVKLLIFFVLLAAVLAGWGVDALREHSPMPTRRRRVLLPMAGVFVTAMVVWLAAWLAPGLITAAAARAFVRARSLFLDPSRPLTSQQTLAAATYLLQMLRLHLPGLMGFSLAAIAWLVAADRGKGWARRALPAAVGVGVLQLVLTNSSVNPTVPKGFYAYRPPVLDQVDRGSGPYRFAYIQRDPFYPPEASEFINLDSVPEARGLSMLAQSGFSSRLTLSHGSMLAKADVVQNIDLDKSLPTSFVEFWVFLLRHSQDLAHHDCLLGRSNVRYLIRARLPSATVSEVGTVFNGSAERSVLYETRCYAPRTYIAENAVCSSNAFETLSRLSDATFNPAEKVYISSDREAVAPTFRSANNVAPTGTCPDEIGRPPRAGLKPGATNSRVQITDYQPNTVTLRAEPSRPGYVVLLDRYDPNWHATLDNREVPVLRANHIFRAVRAGAGAHVIRFYYRQGGLRIGAALSACSIALLVMLWKVNPRVQ
jgi:small-conductance mechanosensitive channel